MLNLNLQYFIVCPFPHVLISLSPLLSLGISPFFFRLIIGGSRPKNHDCAKLHRFSNFESLLTADSMHHPWVHMFDRCEVFMHRNSCGISCQHTEFDWKLRLKELYHMVVCREGPHGREESLEVRVCMWMKKKRTGIGKWSVSFWQWGQSRTFMKNVF